MRALSKCYGDAICKDTIEPARVARRMTEEYRPYA
jgi:hypothetical protein